MDKREMSAAELLEHLYRGLNIEPDVQAEMDTQDLLQLGSMNETRSETQSSEPAASTQVETKPAPAQTQRPKGLAVGCTVLLIGAIVAGALYDYPAVDEPVPSLTRVALVDTPTETDVVLFANPFDDTEVFEFPPGTSEHEARDIVAGLLLKRAMDRQAQLR
jgi:hypothetical protein